MPLPIPLPTTSDAIYLLEDNLSHRPLAGYRSGEIFTQDVRPEQLLEGKVRFLLRSMLQALAESRGLALGKVQARGPVPFSADVHPTSLHAPGCTGHS